MTESGQELIKSHEVKVLEILAKKIGLTNVTIEERKYITGEPMEYAIMASGYLTKYDIKLLSDQGFEITGIYPSYPSGDAHEFMIIVGVKK